MENVFFLYVHALAWPNLKTNLTRIHVTIQQLFIFNELVQRSTYPWNKLKMKFVLILIHIQMNKENDLLTCDNNWIMNYLYSTLLSAEKFETSF